QGLSVGGDIEGLRVLTALEDAHELAGGEVDDADSIGVAIGGRQLGLVDVRAALRRPGDGHVEELARVRGLDAGGAVADRDGGDDLAGGRIDRHDVAGDFIADVDERPGGGRLWLARRGRGLVFTRTSRTERDGTGDEERPSDQHGPSISPA